jgi:hypothetical protein
MTEQTHAALVERKVGVFTDADGRHPRAYTLWYNPEWDGCCEHIVRASSGAEAKKLAIRDHRASCVRKGESDGFK